jgi:hypothetical protein
LLAKGEPNCAPGCVPKKGGNSETLKP